MSVALSPETEMVIQRLVESGRYQNADELVRHALLEMEEDERSLAELRAEVMKGIEQIERGEVVDWTPDLFDRLKKEAIEESRLGRPVKDAVKP